MGVRKWAGGGCVSDANRADVTAHEIWWRWGQWRNRKAPEQMICYVHLL